MRGIPRVLVAEATGIPSEVADSAFRRSSVVYEGMLNQLSHLEVWILDFWRCYDVLLMEESRGFVAW